jgi:hypothetical protein
MSLCDVLPSERTQRLRNLRSALSSFSEDKTVRLPRREVAAYIKLYDKLK